MLISKFDLYKSEWLELVFDDRNKEYGAYNLRQHYSQNMVKAMGIAFLGITATALVVGILIKPVAVPAEHFKITTVPIIDVVIEHPKVIPPKPVTHAHVTAPSAASPVVATKAFVPLVTTVDNKAIDPPPVTDLKGAIGPVDVNGLANSINKGVFGGPPESPGVPENGNAPVEAIGLERMPEPYGGASAWSKFLKKNLEYPDMAVDQHMQGRVLVSFIIEKDGSLSHFIVERGMGFGMDEEALRVLKRAPAWRPGLQNGQPVRVKYTIPINFHMEE